MGTKIFVHGGHDGAQWLNDLYVLETTTLVWAKPTTSGLAPSARACHTMSKVGKKLYLFGGYDGHRCFNDMDVIDTESFAWTQANVEGLVPLARNAHTMTVIGTRLFMFGGHSGNKHLKDLHIFDTETSTWAESDAFGSSPKGLRGHTANLIGNRIYLFGGYDGRGRSNDLYILDTEAMAWAHPLDVEGAPAGRQRHTACVIGNKYLFVFGGFDGNKWLNDVFVLDIGRIEANEIAGEAVSNLICNLKKLLNSPVLSDVSFIIEGKQLYAHKAILITQSEHFKAMFLGGMRESTENSIEIRDWSYTSYYHLMEFLYTGNISNFTPSGASELLGLSDAYTLKYLKKLCQNCLIHAVCVENVCDILILANRHSANELKRFCLSFMTKHFPEVNTTQGFEHLEQVPNLLIEVTRLVFSKLDH